MVNLTRCLITMSDKAISLIYNSVKDRTEVSLEQFANALKDWELIELMQDNKLFGVVMKKENELHVSFDGVPKFSIRKYIKQTIGKVIDNYGFAITSVTKGNEKGLKFCKRFGYVQIGEDATKIYMKCDRCNYVLK